MNIYQRHNLTCWFQRFGVHIFTVFATKFKCPISPDFLGFTYIRIHKAELWKKIVGIKELELTLGFGIP